MKELSASSSTYYKARAGTAYPLVERLVTAGMLEYAEASGNRGDRLVTVTAAGLGQLQNWLAGDVGLPEVAHTLDLFRLRVFYLGAISAEERERVFSGALGALEQHLELCHRLAETYRKMGDSFSCLATEGVIAETEARIGWLSKIRIAATAMPTGKPGIAENGEQ
jgi:DNA-binding PadR family transcriptional regulator